MTGLDLLAGGAAPSPPGRGPLRPQRRARERAAAPHLSLLALLAACLPAPASAQSADTAQPPTWVVSCAPLRELNQAVQQIDGVREALEARGVSLALNTSSPGGPGDLNLDGTLTLALWAAPHAGFELTLPMWGDAGAIQAALAERSPSGLAHEDGQLRMQMGHRALQVQLSDQTAVFRSAPDMRLNAGFLHPELAQGLPTGPGCLADVRLPLAGGGALLGLAYVPLSARSTEGPALRIKPPLPLPTALLTEAAPPPDVGSSRAPHRVATLGIALDKAALAALSAWASNDLSAPMGRRLAVAAEIFPEGLRIGPGLSVAVFDNGGGAPSDLALWVPLDTDGHPLSKRKLRKLAEALGQDKLGGEARRLDRGLYERTGQPQGAATRYVGVRRGALVLASTAELASEVQLGEGVRWFKPSRPQRPGQAFAALGPAAQTHLGPGARDVSVILSLSEGTAELSLDTGPHLPPGAFTLALLSSVVSPRVETWALRLQRAEASHLVDAIFEAELAYKAAKGAYLPLGKAPRPLHELDGELAPWLPFDGWEALVLHAERVRGTYWVEIRGAGAQITVYGAIDIDGDGTPALFTRTLGDSHAVLLSGPDVY